MAFIDGGNQEILHAPNFSLQVNRVYFNLFQGKRRIPIKSDIPPRIEFLSLTTSNFNQKERDMSYETFIFPVDDKFYDYLPQEKDMSFKSVARASFYGGERYDLERVASIARRFAEWTLSHQVIEKELEEDDIVVRDGSLQVSFANENIYSEKGFESAKKVGAIFTGLSKTSHLATDGNSSLLGSINRFADECQIEYPTWCYCPVGSCSSQEYRALITIVKLNPHSNHVFRYEILKEQARELKKAGVVDVVSALAENSNDPVFPGYPYGLIDADLHARVREDEKEIYKTRILSEISKKKGMLLKVLADLRSADAHDILNNIIGE